MLRSGLSCCEGRPVVRMTEPACYLCCRALSSLQFRCENHEPARLFCSENHLNLHKPGQAADCLPWSIEASPQYGRYLVASRDIQPGEEVLQEEALCWGPQHAATASLCLECLDQVGEEEEEVCGSCGYPLCGRHGESGSHPTHSLECAVFTRNNHRLGPEDRLDLELHYPLVEMVRCLVLMETSQEVSSTLAMLMDHGEERRAEPEKYLEPYRDLITQLVSRLKLGAEEEILKIIGYFDVNSLAVRSDQGSYAGRGLYPVASLMSHDCVCNTRNIITGRALQCRATVFIPAGSSITTHYVSPLLDITARRARLREKWFFDCSCARCEDTTGTDLGTFLSALRCPACTAGFSLPVLSEAPAQFRCEVCRHCLPAAQALHTIKMWEPLIQAMGTFQTTGLEEKRRLIGQLENIFHPTHSIVLDLKLNIANKLCRDGKGLMESSELAELENKMILCEEILSVLNIVYPGLSKYRGLLLHELSETILVRSSKLFNREKLTNKLFLEDLTKVSALLTEGIRCLEHDRKGSLESEVCSNMRKMQVTSEDFKNFINFL